MQDIYIVFFRTKDQRCYENWFNRKIFNELAFAGVIFCGFQESNPEIDQKLIDQIEIKTFIVSRDQLADIFRTDEDPVQLTNGELTKKRNENLEIYLVVKVKNNNVKAVSGTLWLRPYGYGKGLPFVFDHLKPHMNTFKIYASFTNSGFVASYKNDISDFEELPFPVKIRWEKSICGRTI